ncbi:MAG: glycerol-3-phosphate 1-O-acyltransferase PlsY [Elusimicrobiota bacterium]|jgi:glycerol-3-phosphate acyltransferase PlsY|nr:glycerol-3-phosphate 1-O-acyltransferase PlsY [Elusimicrobiota bacterium]
MSDFYNVIKFLVFLFFVYILGAIPFSYIITKIHLNKDITELGSKNAGATNVFRNVGKIPAIFTLILDILKGYLTVKISYWLFPNNLLFAIISGAIVIFAHSFSIFLKFKGGKSVATSLGVFWGLAPLAVFISIIIFISSLGFFGIVSLGSIAATLFLPIIIYSLNYDKAIFIMSILIAIFIIYRHKENIKKLINGTEKKIFF